MNNMAGSTEKKLACDFYNNHKINIAHHLHDLAAADSNILSHYNGLPLLMYALK